MNKLKKNDNILFSALTWPTNVMPLIQLGLNPVPLDCELDTLNVSPEILEKKLLNSNTKFSALFLTNVLGFSSNINRIKEICLEKDILLIEDNCESLGSIFKETRLGNFGLAATFSFFVGHHLSTIEGGMVVTDNPELHEILVSTRSHGWVRNNSQEQQKLILEKSNVSEFYSKYFFYVNGFNFRPSEINGFLGNEQLKFWDQFVDKREQNFLQFLKEINLNKDLINIKIEGLTKVSNFAVPLIFKTKNLFNKYKLLFEKENVEIRPILAGDITNQEFFLKNIEVKKPKEILKNAQFIHEHGFYFGNNSELTNNEIKRILKIIKNE